MDMQNDKRQPRRLLAAARPQPDRQDDWKREGWESLLAMDDESDYPVDHMVVMSEN